MKPSNVLVLAGLVFAAAVASCKSNTINAGIGAMCTESSSCPSGNVCVNGECRAQCQVNADCKDPALVCLDGMCSPLAVDSGVVDSTSGVDSSSSKDSGTLDSAPEAASVPAAFAGLPTLWRVTQGSTAAVEVDLSRGSLTGAVDVTVTGLPPGVALAAGAPDGGRRTPATRARRTPPPPPAMRGARRSRLRRARRARRSR